MRAFDLFYLAVVMMISALFLTSAQASAPNPKERIDYWRNTYTELSPSDDPRAARAHDIFTRVRRAAGTRPGVVPRLFIIKTDPLNLTLPIAIPDGGIILSKRVLDICYQDPATGDDRLAFVLAHEIAHLLKDDFWHMKFFQAIEASIAKEPQHHEELDEVLRMVKLTDKVHAKELQADEHGIVYASMAGFNTRAIVTQDDQVNFFADWVRALEPSRLRGKQPENSHPNPQQRAEAVKARLRQILDKMELFNLGLRFYQAGNYTKAILAFQDFLQFFPSREVYHNLAASHHQLALQYYTLWKQTTPPFPFKLSMAIDPESRANMIALRSHDQPPKLPAELFAEHLDKAIAFYQTAIDLDPTYLLSYDNLGCALIAKGEYYKAIAILQDALKISPDDPETLNNLGVAFFFAENLRKAKTHLIKAHERAPAYDAPVFNLGKLAHIEGRSAETKRYWTTYLQIDSASLWADGVRQYLSPGTPRPARPSSHRQPIERLMGVGVGYFEDEVPKQWGVPKTFSLSLEQDPFKIALYANSLMTLSQDEEILMLITLQHYGGTSAKGIAVGSLAHDLSVRYGRPSTILHMTRGESWVYDAQGITFQLRDGQVVSWLLF